MRLPTPSRPMMKSMLVLQSLTLVEIWKRQLSGVERRNGLDTVLRSI